MSGEIVTHDRKFLDLCLPTVKLERLHTGMLWAEGPVYFPLGNYLLWSDIPNNRILQWADGMGCRVFRQAAASSAACRQSGIPPPCPAGYAASPRPVSG